MIKMARHLKAFTATTFLLFQGMLLAAASLQWEQTHLDVKPSGDGGAIVGVYAFENKGDRTVNILQVSSSCGCTVPELEKRSYAPGEHGEIRAIFKPGDRTGPQRNVITVTTDDPDRPLERLIFETDIPVPAKIIPRIVLWRIGSEADWKESEITLNPGWKIKSLELPTWLEGELLEVSGDASKRQLRLRARETGERVKFELPLIFEEAKGELREMKVIVMVL